MRGRLLGMVLPLALGHWVFLPLGYAENEPPVADPAAPLSVLHAGPTAPGVNYPPTPMPNLPFPGTMPDEREPEHGVKGLLHKCNLFCWSHHNSPGCGSPMAECTFIFGSCRKFYGEPCMPRPDPYPPVSPGYGYGYGYGVPAPKGCGCSW